MGTRRLSLTGFLLLSGLIHAVGLGISGRWISRPPAYDIDRTPPPTITIDLTEFERPKPEPVEEVEFEELIEPEPEPEPEPVEQTDVAEVLIQDQLEEPIYLRNPPPTYPLVARRQGWEGEALLRVDIDIRGRVEIVQLVRSSGHTILDDAAIHAVRRWQFSPARFAGQPVKATVEIPIRFSLQ
jgi:protein TonB